MGLAIPVHKEKIEREQFRKSGVQTDPELLKMRKIIRDEKATERAEREAKKAKSGESGRNGKDPMARKAGGKLTGPGNSGCAPDMYFDETGDGASSDGPDPDSV